MGNLFIVHFLWCRLVLELFAPFDKLRAGVPHNEAVVGRSSKLFFIGNSLKVSCLYLFGPCGPPILRIIPDFGLFFKENPSTRLRLAQDRTVRCLILDAGCGVFVWSFRGLGTRALVLSHSSKSYKIKKAPNGALKIGCIFVNIYAFILGVHLKGRQLYLSCEIKEFPFYFRICLSIVGLIFFCF